MLRKTTPGRNRRRTLHHLIVRRFELVDGPQATRQRVVPIRRSHPASARATPVRTRHLAATLAIRHRPALKPQPQAGSNAIGSLRPRRVVALILSEPSVQRGRRPCFAVLQSLARNRMALLKVRGLQFCVALAMINPATVVLRTAPDPLHPANHREAPASRGAKTMSSSSNPRSSTCLFW